MVTETVWIKASFKRILNFLKYNFNLKNQYDIFQDYLFLKNKYPFLTAGKEIESDENRVLIVSLSNFLYQVKLEAMLAKALQLAGVKPVVLTRRGFFWPKKYFRLFGINEFVYLEDYLDTNSKDSAEQKDIDSILKNPITFQAIKKWAYHGCRVGPQVLSSLGRMMHGNPDFSRSDINDLLNIYLKKEVSTVHAAEKILEDINPHILLFNEANGTIYGAFFDLAYQRKLNIIQFIQPLRDDALIFKRFTAESKSMHPNSLSKNTFERIKNLPWTEMHEKKLCEEFSYRYGGKWFLSYRNQMGKSMKNKEEILSQLNIDKNKKIAIIFSHVLWDANLFYGEDLFEDYEEWFVETIKAACGNPNVNWIVKLHPANVWKRNLEDVKGELREVTLIRDKIGNLPPNIFLLYPDTDINTFSLFNVVDYGITVRGTVGMELPCFGVPVFTAGTGRYSGFGFTIDFTSREEYLKKLAAIQDFPPLTKEQTIMAKKHAYTVFILRQWIMKSFKSKFNYKKRGTHPLDHNLYPEIYSFQEMEKAEDLKKFSKWVLESKEVDYMQKWDEL